ncbi:hypothetical protein WN55_06463 [Dufourea novaeangliae]|uniref:Chitin-binding type-2 domain-containing protein n=1 Tax=Dufourea novaeangliae TaxID=178035 RepID=A0A154P0Y4_DUFNO|nr:hypothetical protein WN55_06463 [Dufourea novaeangliae]
MSVRIFILYSILIAVESSKCPEPRKPHNVSCTVFFKCVNLPGGGYVWVPSKCTEGLIFQPYLRMCVLPGDTWTCDTVSTDSSIITNRYDTPELINPNETSYLGLTEDSSNFSELIDSSYTTDSIPGVSDREVVTPYPLIEIEETMKNQQEKMTENPAIFNNQQYHSKKEYSMLYRLMHHLLIYKEITIPLEFLALLPTPPKIKSESSAETELFQTNEQNILMSYLIQNRIQQTNSENTITTNKKLQNGIEEGVTLNSEDESIAKIRASNSTLEILLNDSENENNLISITDHTGQKQYLTTDRYKSLSYHVDPKYINVIPCVKNVRMPNATDCVKYYICDPKMVSLIQYSCPSNTAFNKYTRICDRESYNKCVQNKDNSKLSESGNNTNKMKISENVCTEHGKTKDVTSEIHYYICYSSLDNSHNFKSIRMMCPNGLIFCQRKKVCTTKRLCKTA